MVRKRVKLKPIQLGKEEEIKYMKACEIARYCDNLPMLNEKQEAELFGVFYDIMEDLVENIKKQ